MTPASCVVLGVVGGVIRKAQKQPGIIQVVCFLEFPFSLSFSFFLWLQLDGLSYQ
jgi:hypothetical protein